MTRLLGALLIAAASSAFGIVYISGEKRQLNALHSAEQLLKIIAGELETRLTPLPELFSRLPDRCDGSAAAFGAAMSARLDQLGERQFRDIWAESVEIAFPMLGREERALLCALGLSLGRYELERQLAELTCTLEQLSIAIARRSSALPEKRRLGLGLACTGGALLVIVLL
ncbi:MAG: stage III sporulation protein AB [Candidatus Limivicinus sp.]